MFAWSLTILAKVFLYLNAIKRKYCASIYLRFSDGLARPLGFFDFVYFGYGFLLEWELLFVSFSIGPFTSAGSFTISHLGWFYLY